MSAGITVEDFKYVRGVNDAEYIELLKNAYEGQKYITSKAIAKLKKQPEPKTGVWLTYTNVPQYMLCKCSACGADILVPYLGKNTIFNYCPNCGAKMEGDLT